MLPNAKAGKIYTKKGIFMGYEAEYSAFVIPENRRRPNNKLFNIPVIRIPSLSNNSNNYPVFLLNGGPGVSNIWQNNFPEYLLEDHDIIMIGYRGVDGSEKLDCPDIKSLLKTKNIFNKKNIYRLVEEWDNEAEKFRMENIDIDGFDMYEVVRDIESLRKVLGYDKINFYAFSYGTMIAQLYINYYSEYVNKLVLLGARPYGFYLHDPIIIEHKLNEFYENLLIKKEITSNITNIDVLIDSAFIDKNRLKTINNFEITKFEIAAFQQLYNYASTKYLINAFFDLYNGKSNEINRIYTKYNTNFTEDLVLGDYALKTNCTAGMDIDSSYYFPSKKLKTSGNYLTEGINKWYLSFNICRSNLNIDFEQKNIPNKTLFISGEFDFISPYEFVKTSLLPYFENNEFFLVPEQGHDDLIKKNSRYLQNKITAFLIN
ncbi:MAG: alpha/beta hydrolase [Chlorobi bacterium]|nr:alpha/beta hydrolase [Chlorobiota bacterium]